MKEWIAIRSSKKKGKQKSKRIEENWYLLQVRLENIYKPFHLHLLKEKNNWYFIPHTGSQGQKIKKNYDI